MMRLYFLTWCVMFSFKLLSIILILLVTLIAGGYPFLKKLKTRTGTAFPIGEALASGVFLGAGLIHMLGDASQGFSELGLQYPVAFLLAGSAFLVLLLLEHIGREIYEHEDQASMSFAVLAVVMLSIHSFLVGTALGLSASWSIAIIILLAILAHKWAASFALAVQINRSRLSIRAGMALFSVFALMVPLGVLIGGVVQHGLHDVPWLEPALTALSAGTFLYLGTLHGLERSVMVKRCCNLQHFFFVIIGFALMAVVAVWV